MSLNNETTILAATSSMLLIANDENLTFNELSVAGRSPSGQNILAAAGASADALLAQLLPSGEIETIRSNEQPSLSTSNRFLISYSDRLFILDLDGTKLEWAYRLISGRAIRTIGEVGDQRDLIIKRENGDVLTIDDKDLIDLNEAGIEHFFTKPRVWKIRVQSVTLEYGTPTVVVRDAMKRAGFDPSKKWQIFLLVEGQPKQALTVDSVVDLRTPGIEKIRLMQSNVDNGDGQKQELARQFALLESDIKHLDKMGASWETVIEGGRQWLLIHDFQPTTGYTPKATALALDIPKDYPAAQIDMFYFFPWITRIDGLAIPNTQVRAIIRGAEFQGWSRHRNAACPWDPITDSVMTHLTLVESCLHRELGK
ncbi:multiubiquitin domain-containing protein [Nitrosospira sp. NRS527]|uniref:multiubiquitin domain-containing protein n=1 Tax=Nitrosospira sp. NRS527 TaxID=155925 RepID=UPI001AFBC2EC|nr:multiubiquitin domain-containing protein [Nitrosospira sp. NRS527]BCT69156.1 hypothetical protein NNRS527_02770 [Nitrosospira sp. NRS527]